MAKHPSDSMAFTHAVAEVVSAIPAGKVLTYGDVAALAGAPGHARQVGRILGCFGFDSSVPCHRVVISEGGIAPHGPEQQNVLEREGVTFTTSSHVDMRQHRWHPEEDFY